MVRIIYQTLPIRAETKKHGGFRKRGRPQRIAWKLIYESRRRRKLERNARERWKKITEVAMWWVINDQPQPYNRGTYFINRCRRVKSMNVQMLSNMRSVRRYSFLTLQIMRYVTCVILKVSTRMQHRLHGHTCFSRQLRAWLRDHYATLTEK